MCESYKQGICIYLHTIQRFMSRSHHRSPVCVHIDEPTCTECCSTIGQTVRRVKKAKSLATPSAASIAEDRLIIFLPVMIWRPFLAERSRRRIS